MPENDTVMTEMPRKADEGAVDTAPEQKNWLAKNVHPLLAIGILSLTFFLYWQIIFYGADIERNGMKEIVIYILGALTTVSTQVVSYYFGSSSGSASKSEELKELKKNADRAVAPNNPSDDVTPN